MDKIIHFNSPEGPVWREKTAEERLLEELDNNYKETHSNCCDARMLNGICLACKEHTVSQKDSDY